MGRPKINPEFCVAPDCEKPASASKGYCWAHYTRTRRHGDLTTVLSKHKPPRPIGERLAALSHLNTETGCIEWQGSVGNHGYGVIFRDKTTGMASHMLAHRASYQEAYGDLQDGAQVDHVCFNRKCINPKHLRQLTGPQNKQHKRGARADSTSGIRGVRKQGNAYEARVKLNGKEHYVGRFTSADEADKAVRAKRRDLMPFSEMDKE